MDSQATALRKIFPRIAILLLAAQWLPASVLAMDEPPPEAAGEEAPGEAAEATDTPDAPEADSSPAQAADEAALPVIAVEPLRAEPEPAAPEDEKRPAQLDELVVTATKRAKSVREIPASIIGFSGEELERKGVQSLEEIVRLVPGVNITKPGDNAERITIRGIAGQSSTNATTGVLFGDLSFTDAYLPRVTLDPNPFDLQTVEVLKGPQGTLFGAGALNGAIRYVPQPPVTGAWETKYFVQYTMLENGGAAPIYGAAVNVPVGDDFALRVVGFDRVSPGWIDVLRTGVEDANQIDQQGLRGILGWQPAGRWSGSLTWAWQDTDTADTTVADNLDGRLEAGNRPRGSPSHNVYQFGDLHLEYAFDWGSVVSETGYIRKEAENFFDASSRGGPQASMQPIIAQVDYSFSDSYSQELRLLSPEDTSARWQWVTGLLAWRQDIFFHLDLPVETAGLPLFPGIDLLGLTTAGGQLAAATLQTDATVEEMAWFFDVTRRLWQDWELSLGGRLYQTDSGGEVQQSGLLLLAANQEPERRYSGTIRERGFNPKLSLLWRASDDILSYVAASRGFRPGGIQPGYNPLGQPPPDFFKADSLWNYEAGVRTQWFDRSLRFDVTAYFVEWTDPQTFQLDSTGVGTYLDNVGGAEARGVDVALQWRSWFGLTATATAAWNKTVTTEPFVTSDQSIAPPGTAWPFAPQWQTATTLTQLVPIGNWLTGIGVTHTWLDEARNNLAPKQNFNVFDFQQWDLQLSLSNPAVAWMPEISLIANNLTDERGVTNHWDGGSIEVTDVTYIRPRALTLRLSGRF